MPERKIAFHLAQLARVKLDRLIDEFESGGEPPVTGTVEDWTAREGGIKITITIDGTPS